MSFPTLTERQAILRKELKDAKANTKRLRNNARARKNFKLRKTKPWRDIRAAWAEKRRAVAERKAQRLAKRQAKENAKRLREQTRKRKLKDPIAEAARIFKEAFDAGKRFQAAEDSARFKTQITVV